MTGQTFLTLTTAARAAAVRRLERRVVDPVALLLAIHESEDARALADARLAAIFGLDAVGGRIWPDGCPVTTGSDALALGCVVDRADSGALIHVAHGPLTFAARISYVTARVGSRLDGEPPATPRRTA